MNVKTNNMSAVVDVLAVMDEAAQQMAGVAVAEGHYFDDADVNGMCKARAAVAELIVTLQRIRDSAHFDANLHGDYEAGNNVKRSTFDFPRCVQMADAALARCKGGAA